MHRQSFAVVIVLAAAALLAACTSAMPPLVPAAATRAPADVEAGIRRAAWDYVHHRYPDQPWPDDVYLVREQDVVGSLEIAMTHVVFDCHSTGFLWEGEVRWRTGCGGDCIQVEGVRELFVLPPRQPTQDGLGLLGTKQRGKPK